MFVETAVFWSVIFVSFYNNFISACNIRGIPPTVACKNSGISESAYKKWENSSPKSDTIIKLATTLDFSIDYLLTGNIIA